MIENRPDWCISRQRTWGVPLALFVHKSTGALHPRTQELIEQVAQRVEQGGIEAWFALEPAELLGAKDAFYDVLFRGARNEQLRQMTAGLHARVTYLRSFSLAQPGRLTESLSELRDIMNAVKARDADAVSNACLHHIKRAGQASIDALPEPPEASKGA